MNDPCGKIKRETKDDSNDVFSVEKERDSNSIVFDG